MKTNKTMKKFFIIIGMLVAMAGSVLAQDTLLSDHPKVGYYYNSWPLINGYYTSSTVLMKNNGYIHAIFFDTEDTLPVYGIAASLTTWDDKPTIDSTWKKVYEYLGLYKYVGDTLQTASDSLLVHMKDTPVSYYFKLSHMSPWLGMSDSILPFYERYFDEPVPMTDTFLVGITMQTHWRTNYQNPWDTSTYSYADSFYVRPVFLIGLDPWSEDSATVIRGITKYYNYLYDTILYQIISDLDSDAPYAMPMMFHPLIFPILTPPDTTQINPVDTTEVDTSTVDTLGISMRLLERYVNIAPNPAAKRATVTSSFGLRRVELLDAAGIRVRELEVTGYTAPLDLVGLPAGTYLVRITTPSGAVTKKLIVLGDE